VIAETALFLAVLVCIGVVVTIVRRRRCAARRDATWMRGAHRRKRGRSCDTVE
jgi:hypothetical protein